MIKLKENEKMDTKYKVHDFRKNNGFVFLGGIDFVIMPNGSLDCAHGDSFVEKVKDFNSLNEHEKDAMRNFKKSMDKKYGYNKHEYLL